MGTWNRQCRGRKAPEQLFRSAVYRSPPPGFARPATCPWNAIRAVGGTGTTIIVRLSAFLLFCIGIQVFWNGARELLLELMAAAT